MNNDTPDLPAWAGRENGVRDSAGLHRLLGPTTSFNPIRPVQPQLAREWDGI